MGNGLDPIKYEVFIRRLKTILEEGRQAIAMVSGSPAIAEGGESMTSLYDGNGKGTINHAVGTAIWQSEITVIPTSTGVISGAQRVVQDTVKPLY